MCYHKRISSTQSKLGNLLSSLKPLRRGSSLSKVSCTDSQNILSWERSTRSQSRSWTWEHSVYLCNYAVFMQSTVLPMKRKEPWDPGAKKHLQQWKHLWHLAANHLSRPNSLQPWCAGTPCWLQSGGSELAPQVSVVPAVHWCHQWSWDTCCPTSAVSVPVIVVGTACLTSQVQHLGTWKQRSPSAGEHPSHPLLLPNTEASWDSEVFCTWEQSLFPCLSFLYSLWKTDTIHRKGPMVILHDGFGKTGASFEGSSTYHSYFFLRLLLFYGKENAYC